MLKYDVNDMLRKMTRFALEHSKESKKVVRAIAFDTGDLENSITSTRAKKEGNIITVTVFCNTADLGKKRASKYKYKRGPKKGQSYKVNKLYPIWVHDGHNKRGGGRVEGRPFFTIAYLKLRERLKFYPDIEVVNK
jgi:hypothetical protein